MKVLHFTSWTVLVGVLLVCAAGPGRPVHAHATVVASEPADGLTLSEAPRAVRLRLAEDVSLRFSSLQLLDANGRVIDVPGLDVERPEPNLLSLTLPKLSPGVYSVFYKTLSEADGHFTRGLVVFGIGVPADRGADAGAVGEMSVPLPEILFRWVFFGSLLAMVGAVAVAAVVLDRRDAHSHGIAQLRQNATRSVFTCAIGCAGLGLVAGLGNLWSQAVVLQSPVTDDDGSVLSVAWNVVRETRWGTMWLIREVVLSAAGIVLLSLRGSYNAALTQSAWANGPSRSVPHARRSSLLCNPLWLAAAALSVVIAVAQALMGHAGGVAERTFLAVAADAVHLLAAGVWIGGTLALAVGLLPQLKRDNVNFALLVRAGWGPFSVPAAVSVALVIVTGLFSLGQQVASVDALISTPYGQALIAKIGLVAVMGGLGLLNSTALHPTQVRGFLARVFKFWWRWPYPLLSAIPNRIKCDILLALFVLLAASVITASPAPRGPTFLVAAEDVRLEQSKVVDDVMVTLSAKPNRPGQNVLTVFAASTRRPAPAEIMRVILRFTYRDRELGRVSAVAEAIERDRFVVGGSQLSLAGMWNVEVVVRRRGLEDTIARFDWSVSPPGELQPTILSKWPIRLVTEIVAGTTLLLSVLLLAIGINSVRVPGRHGHPMAPIRGTTARAPRRETSAPTTPSLARLAIPQTPAG